jgi:polysaccharide biosynthesis transport protein
MFFEQLQKLQYHVEKQQWSMDQVQGVAKNTEVILLEIPALEGLAMKPGAQPIMQQVVLVSRANRIWTKVDVELLNIFKKVTGNNPVSLLNGVEIPFAEDILGKEVGKKGLIGSLIAKITGLVKSKNKKPDFVKF